MDRFIERVLFVSRWLLVPMYLGLAGALFFLVYTFGAEFFHVAFGIVRLGERKVMLSVLSLIDIVLVANLLLMVILSGYENFVSKIEVAAGSERPAWMGELDFSGLKLKLFGSIVAVAAVDLLGAFMNVAQFTSEQLAWKIGIQITLVLCGVLFAVMDRIAAQTRRIEESGHARQVEEDGSPARRMRAVDERPPGSKY